MRPTERLEMCFTLNPRTLVCTIMVDDHQLAQRTFRDQSQMARWTSTLEDIANVTRDAQRAPLTSDRGETMTLTQARAAPEGENQMLKHGDGQLTRRRGAVSPAPSSSSYRAETSTQGVHRGFNPPRATAAQAQSEQKHRVLEIDGAEPGTVTSSYGSTATGREMLLPKMSMHVSQQPQRGDPRTKNYSAGALFETTSVESPSSSRSQSIPELSGSLSSPMSSRTSVAMEEQTPKLKRRKKLDMLLERIRDQTNPDQIEHNEKVDNLCNSTILFTSAAPTTATQFGHLLGDLGHVSDVLGFMYGLLSWEVFRREEDRLVQEEGQSARWAAKRMNDEMFKQSDRHTTTKDWASDGRRAAGMVFGSIVKLNAATQSMAVFLLADLAILDNLIKIAHFPVLRERFAIVFKEIHESRERRHNLAEDSYYKVFDFEAFLSMDRQSINLATVDPKARQPQISETEHPTPPVINLQDLLWSSAGVDNSQESLRKRRRLSRVGTAEDMDAAWSLSLNTDNTRGRLRIDTVPTLSNPLDVVSDMNKQRDSSPFTGNDGAQSGEIADSLQTQDYNILFGPSPDFDASFHGQKST